MNLAALILLALKVSIGLNVFGLGLQTDPADISYLIRTRSLFVRSMIAIFVIMPLFAIALARLFDLRPAVKIALVVLAISPIPPILPRKELKAGGRHDYVISLLVVASILATVLIPVSMNMIGHAFALPLSMTAGPIALLALRTILLPLALGMAVRLVARTIADRAAVPVVAVGTAMLLLGVIPIVFKARHALAGLIGGGTLIAFVAFCLAGLGVGHFLGGPNRENRTVLALSTAARHPGIAAAIAQANFAHQKLALPAILLFLIINGLVSVPYVTLSKRWAAAGERREAT